MAKDLIHNAVRHALEKDGWTIVADPFRLKLEEFVLRADLAAQRANADGVTIIRIVVEIKSFASPSFVHELQQALGQYLMYRDALKMNSLEHELYLAVSLEAFQNYFGQLAAQTILHHYQIKLVVVDDVKEEVQQWIEQTNID